MFEEIAYEHGADLRRAATAYRAAHEETHGRAASRAGRAKPGLTARVGGGVRVALHRPAAPVGCEA